MSDSETDSGASDASIVSDSEDDANSNDPFFTQNGNMRLCLKRLAIKVAAKHQRLNTTELMQLAEDTVPGLLGTTQLQTLHFARYVIANIIPTILRSANGRQTFRALDVDFLYRTLSKFHNRCPETTTWRRSHDFGVFQRKVLQHLPKLSWFCGEQSCSRFR